METDIYFARDSTPTKDFYWNPGKTGDAGGGYQFCACCGARQCYSTKEFNDNTEWNGVFPGNIDKLFNRGLLFLLNPPDPENVKELLHTQIDKVAIGENTLYIRLKLPT